MFILRTPDERFLDLPDFPFQPNYAEINGVRVHYLDEGNGEVILCLHGEPTWSFLYRKMIPILSKDHRVVAMDFIGFGRSDKSHDKQDYSFKMHKDTLASFIEELKLERISLVVHDWGGLIGLTVASEMPHRIARLIIMNTGLPIGEQPMPFSVGANSLRGRQTCRLAGSYGWLLPTLRSLHPISSPHMKHRSLVPLTRPGQRYGLFLFRFHRMTLEQPK